MFVLFSRTRCVYLDKRYEFNAYYIITKIPAELMNDHEWNKANNKREKKQISFPNCDEKDPCDEYECVI